jgi:tetratricopeptide (TPR) repeat protein
VLEVFVRKFILILLLLCSSQSFAQKSGFGFFSVESQGGSALRLADLDSDVKLDGAFAETTLDMGYYNDSTSALQGLFKIQLPAGAVIRDFALRIGDKWQFGTLTEKHKARQTFEEIVRRGADPAVLAWNNGVEYQVRIFPFPSKGKRFIRIRYWQDLQGNSGKFVYMLPLPSGVKLDTFHLKLNAHARALEGVQVGEAYSRMAYLKPSADEKESFGAILDERNFVVPGDFRVSALEAQPAKDSVWTGQAAPHGDMIYVGARFFTELPERARVLPRRLLVFLDTSRSAKPDYPEDLARDLAALSAKYSQVSYYEFDASVRKVLTLDPAHATYDGGTDFKKVLAEVEKQVKAGGGDMDVLLLSDAMPSMQKEADFSDSKINGAKIFVLPVKSKFNPHFASLLAEKSGGAVLPPATRDSAESVSAAYLHSVWRVEGLHYNDGTATDVYPEPGTPLAREEGIYLYFRSKNARIPHSVTLAVSNGSERRELKADFSNPQNVPEIENLWAMKKLMSLVPHADEYAQDLAAHAERYKLVSPVTSYIVLENEWDYQRFNITNREENMPASTGMMMKGGSIGAFGEGRAGAPEAPRQAAAMAAPRKKAAEMDAAADKALPMGTTAQAPDLERRARPMPMIWPTPPPYQPPAHPGLDGAISASEAGTRYAKGYLLFGKLDKIYAEKNTPDMKDAWFFVEIARAYAAKGEKAKALRVISNLFEISEEDGRALRTMGLVGCIAGDCEMAVQAFKLAMDLRPEEPQNYRDLAWYYAELGRLTDAQATMALLRGKHFHARFPGMDQLLERESAWIDALAKGDDRAPAGQDVRVYSWITWNNDNSDVDFHIRENKSQTVWYQNRKGQGELSNDFTQGYGPEVYTNRQKNISPDYFAHYFRPDRTSEDQAVVVKFATIERVAGGRVVIHSRLFPLYTPQQYVRID